jgi:hypothetical protein
LFLEQIFDDISKNSISLDLDCNVVTFAAPERQGWLWKRSTSGLQARWRKRYFLVNDGCLYYFLHPFEMSKASPRLILPLENASILTPSKTRIIIIPDSHPIHNDDSASALEAGFESDNGIEEAMGSRESLFRTPGAPNSPSGPYSNALYSHRIDGSPKSVATSPATTILPSPYTGPGDAVSPATTIFPSPVNSPARSEVTIPQKYRATGANGASHLHFNVLKVAKRTNKGILQQRNLYSFEIKAANEPERDAWARALMAHCVSNPLNVKSKKQQLLEYRISASEGTNVPVATVQGGPDHATAAAPASQSLLATPTIRSKRKSIVPALQTLAESEIDTSTVDSSVPSPVITSAPISADAGNVRRSSKSLSVTATPSSHRSKRGGTDGLDFLPLSSEEEEEGGGSKGISGGGSVPASPVPVSSKRGSPALKGLSDAVLDVNLMTINRLERLTELARALSTSENVIPKPATHPLLGSTGGIEEATSGGSKSNSGSLVGSIIESERSQRIALSSISEWRTPAAASSAAAPPSSTSDPVAASEEEMDTSDKDFDDPEDGPTTFLPRLYDDLEEDAADVGGSAGARPPHAVQRSLQDARTSRVLSADESDSGFLLKSSESSSVLSKSPSLKRGSSRGVQNKVLRYIREASGHLALPASAEAADMEQ